MINVTTAVAAGPSKDPLITTVHVPMPQPSPSGESSAVDDSLRLGLGLGLGLGLPIVLIAVYGAYTLVKAPGAGKEAPVTQLRSGLEVGMPGQRQPSLSADLAFLTNMHEVKSETLTYPEQRLYVQPASSTLEISRI